MGSYIIGDTRIEADRLSPGLYVVATPIGNLGDITLRALATLAAADCIACEDKRVSVKLLDRYAIRSKLTAYHEHNAEREGPKLLEKLSQGAAVALISDAGMPLISDPGQRLVAAARQAELPVFTVPGASAPVAALSISGIATQSFAFDGFLPAKQGARRTALERLAGYTGTLVFFESPSRLAASLADMAAVYGVTRRAAICRELTKLHEEVRAGPVEELAVYYRDHPVKGEIVIVVEPIENADPKADPDVLLLELLAELPVSRAASEAAKLTGLSKRELYRRALALRQSE